MTPSIVQGNRYRELKQDEIDLLKRTVAKGTDDDQFALFLWVCRKHRVDPLTRQIYCILYNVTKHHQDEKGIWMPGKQMVITMGIDGYRSLAARNHPDYGASDEPVFEMMENLKTPAGRSIPSKATIRMWKKGLEHPVEASAFWEEFAPTDLSSSKADFWNRMPKHMLAKVAESLALRKGYPDMADIYTSEELAQHDQDFTPSGRQIITHDGTAPSGRPVTFEAQTRGSREASQKVLTDKLESHSERKAKEEASKPPIDVKASQSAPQDDPRPIVEIDETSETDPIIRGDITNLLEIMQKHCTMKWVGDWWHCLPKDIETVQAMCKELGFRVRSIVKDDHGEIIEFLDGKRVSGGKEAPKAKPATTPEKSPGPPSEPELVAGTVQQVAEKMTTGTPKRPSVPYINILFKDTNKKATWYACFDRDMFPPLQHAKAKGSHCEILVKKSGNYANVVGLKKIGTQEFEGKLPVINRNREPGNPSLFRE